MAMSFSGGVLGSGDGFVFGDTDEPAGVLIGVGGGQGPVGPAGPVGPNGPAGPVGPAGSLDVAKVAHVTALADADTVLSGSVAHSLQKITVAELKAVLGGHAVIEGLRAGFPAKGVAGVLYVSTDTNLVWRWGGATYVQVGDVASVVADGAAVTTLADADVVPVVAGGVAKKVSWASLKALILAWFSPATATLSNKDLTAKTNKFPSTLVDTTSAQSAANKTLTSATLSSPTVKSTKRVADAGGPSAPALSGDVEVRGPNSTSVAVGKDAQRSLTTGSFDTAIGVSAQHAPLGAGATDATGVFIPDFPTTTASKQTSVGAESGQNVATQIDGITTVGFRATAGAVNGTALGILSRADHQDSVALGSNTQTTAANQVMVGGRDIEVTDPTMGVILASPDKKRWRVTVDNAGVLSAAPVI